MEHNSSNQIVRTACLGSDNLVARGCAPVCTPHIAVNSVQSVQYHFMVLVVDVLHINNPGPDNDVMQMSIWQQLACMILLLLLHYKQICRDAVLQRVMFWLANKAK